MDGKQQNALQPFDEAWFDVANSCGREFELPNISTPINPQWSDNEKLVFLEDQQPDVLENNYELVITSSSCSGNVVDSFPPLKMVPAITTYVLTVDMQEGTYPPVNDQEIRSFITDSPAFLINVSRGRWNQVAYVPVIMTNIYQGSDADINHVPKPLQNVRHSKGITSNVYQPGKSIHTPDKIVKMDVINHT
ncbi:unnamed protein product [Prunus armeniaca]|uniref:Uncharacterized protein n=1 Tax=Prunus armeniaca TaxID=36596 RepID=A0A6J5UWW4_PRUAR|nr:unnamed protein product [Prunus armeniaca]